VFEQPNISIAQTNLDVIPLTLENVNCVSLSFPWSSNAIYELGLKYDDIHSDDIKFRLEYRKKLFSVSFISHFIESFKNLVIHVVNAPQYSSILLSDCPLLPLNLYNQIVYEWNQTSHIYPEKSTIIELFEAQVNRAPHNIAIVYENISLTYADLNEQANQLAWYLRERYKIQRDELIAFCLERSEYLLIGILGILKAGGAYVPLDISYPKQRMAYIIKDIETKVVLVDKASELRLNEISEYLQGTFSVEEITGNKQWDNCRKDNLPLITNSGSLAYVLYTSGTTGEPKGVMIEHRSVVNRISWMNDSYPLNSNDKILQKTPVIFDVSVWELFWAHWYGATLVLARPEGHREADYLVSTIEKEQISIVHFVPSMLDGFHVAIEESKALLPYLRYIFCSGEALSISLVKQTQALLPHVDIHNLYGPTEATVDVLFYACGGSEKIAIGKPIWNTQAYILDEGLNPVPLGGIGELYIGGVGLARGYWKKPELTLAQFIPNPFQTTADAARNKTENSRVQSIYKTGDLARYRLDGNIDYCGRIDFQVKLKGYRIELEEIASTIKRYPGIRQAVAIVEKGQLIAYYASEKILNEEGLREFLTQQLPSYLLPQSYVWLSNLPVTIQGKLDRKALPKSALQASNIYEPPRNALEKKICLIYAEVFCLPVEKISIQDSFFHLGGDSIIGVKLIHQLNKKLSLTLTVANLFQYKTIACLFNNILSHRIPEVPIIPFSSKQPKLLSSQQESFWFMASYTGGTAVYNVPYLWRVAKDINIDVLEQSIRKIIQRHEILQMVVETDKDGNAEQKLLVFEEEAFPKLRVTTADLTSLKEISQKEIYHIFDLKKERPIRIRLIQIKDTQEWYVSMTVHHIAFDAWSISVFLNDLDAYYKKTALPLLSIQYSDFARWQRESEPFINTTKSSDYLYWKNKLTNYEQLVLPLDNPREDEFNYEGANNYFTVDTEVSNQLRKLAKNLDVSLYDLLLSAFGLLLKKYSNQKSMLLGCPNLTREHSQVADLIGCFVNTIIFRIQINDSDNLIDYIQQVAKEVLETKAHQNFPFEKIVSEFCKERDLSRHPLFQVMFGLDSVPNNKENEILIDVFSTLQLECNIARFDLTVMLNDSDEALKGVWNYATRLFNPSTIKEFIISYEKILAQLSYLSPNSEKTVVSVLSTHQIYSQQIDVNAPKSIKGSSYEAPKTVLEREICDAYARVFNLPVEKIGVHDNFFHLGGDSMIAIRLVSYLNHRVKSNITVRCLFKQPTPAELSHVCLEKNLPNFSKTRYLPFSLSAKINSDEEDRYPASQLQLGMLFESVRGQIGTYHDVFFYEIMLPFNEQRFVNVWKILIQRHPLLRARFELSDAGYDCVIEKSIDFVWTHNKDVSVEKLIESERLCPLDIFHAGVFRILINQQDQRFDLVFSFHHAIADGWSVISLIHEFIRLYRGEEISVAPALSYGSFVAREQEAMKDSQISTFWQNYLSGIDVSKLLLPQDNVQASNGLCEIRRALSFNMVSEIHSLARRLSVTAESIFLWAYLEVLSQFLNQQDVVVGLTSNNRLEEQGGDELFGLFVNMLPFRWHDRDEKIEEAILRIFHEKIKLYPNRYYPYSQMKPSLGEEGIQTGFNFIHFHIIEESRAYIERIDGYERTNIPLMLYVIQEGNDCFTLRFIAHDTIVSESYLNYLASYLEHHLKRALGQEKNVLIPQDRAKFLQWNQTDFFYFNTDETIITIFERRVRQAPEHIAVVYENTILTYEALNTRANQLAHYIRECYQVKPDDLIGLCLSKSEKWVIGILGILKSGAAYIPIDSALPAERIDYILTETQAKAVFVNENSNMESNASAVVEKWNEKKYEQYSECITDADAARNKTENSSANSIAYVIYTSGTTGHPKGVMVEHKALMNTCTGMLSRYFNESRIVNAFSLAQYGFDMFVMEYALPLLTGGHIKLADIHFENLDCQQYNFIQMTPTVYDLKEACITNAEHISIFLGGEAVEPRILEKASKKGIHIVNIYGPTEATVWSISSEPLSYNCQTKLPIGKSLANQQSFILNDQLALLPIGAIGELYIGGASLSRGYLNQTQLTAERFIRNPFQTEQERQENRNVRLYKTGDLVRRLSNGDIEYIGRNDFQVKIHGYRIELAEIQALLLFFPDIQHVIVTIKRIHANDYLIAYYVAAQKLNENKIIDYLSEKLPTYMIPGAFIHLASTPLTVNGKLDYQALPFPDFIHKKYVAPHNEWQAYLVSIWSSILGISEEKIGIKQSFFELGGNSIALLKLQGILSQKHKAISITDFFKFPTLEKLADYLASNNKSQENVIKRTNFLPEIEKDIAIIAISGAFSGCSSIDELWNLVVKQREGVKFSSLDECQKQGISLERLHHPSYVASSGHIEGIDLFDPSFWNISTHEATYMDPQIRKFLEHAWYVLEKSGYLPQRKILNIGVFAGSGNNQYLHEYILPEKDTKELNLWEIATLNSKDALATKVSFLLGLTGPANSINTACSTGLVTVVEACKNLAMGACDMALAGGVSLLMPDQLGYLYQEGMIMSKDGHCRPFDKDASGTAFGSGVGVVLLKRLKEAIADKDSVLGVIKGYATNNDGDRKVGYTAPSVTGQTECIVNAQRMANVSSRDLNYVECHGTATQLGDSIEIKALSDAFALNENGDKPSTHKCIIGSIKANIGHPDSSAGLAGLIKVCMMLQHNIIPGQANFVEPNPELALETTSFEVISTNKSWKKNDSKARLAGISSFGIGGTNAHVVISEYNQVQTFSLEEKTQQLLIFPFSAKSLSSLKNYLAHFIHYVSYEQKSEHDFFNIAYTLQSAREKFDYRTAITATSIDDLKNKLIHKQFSLSNGKLLADNTRIIWMFPGQGTQYTNMARSWYEQNIFFRESVDACIAIANVYLEYDLKQVIFPHLPLYAQPLENKNEKFQRTIHQTEWTQISLFIISYSLAQCLQKSDLKADGYFGHSLGEYVAATMTGVFELVDVIKLIILRGQLMQAMPTGSMISVEAPLSEIELMLENQPVEIAVINSKNNYVLSGKTEAIQHLKKICKQKTLPCKILNTSHAYHSFLMEDAAEKFKEAFKGILLKKPTQLLVSNLTGTQVEEDFITPEYWCKHLRHTVQLEKNIDFFFQQFPEDLLFVEIGAGRGLSSLVESYPKESLRVVKSISLLPSFYEKGNDYPIITSRVELNALLWSYGLPTTFTDDLKQGKVVQDLPGYVFDFQSCWIEKTRLLHSKETLLPEKRWYSTFTYKRVMYLQLSKYPPIQLFKKTLLFAHETLLKTSFYPALKTHQEVLTVVLDKRVETIVFYSQDIIKINPGTEIGYKKLLEHINTRKMHFDTVFHLASIHEEEDNTVDEYLALGFYSLFFIKEYVIPFLSINYFCVLTHRISQITGKDILYPLNGCMVGALRTIKHEYLNIKTHIIDIDRLSDMSYDYFIQATMQSFSFKSEDLFIIRENVLWKEDIVKIQEVKSSHTLINENNVILITGGLGGIGLSVATEISRHHNVHFLLVSRHDVIDDLQKVTLIEQIKERGCKLDIILADIGDKNQVSLFMENIKKTYGSLDGIIHTAGTFSLKDNKHQLEEIKKTFLGKVNGMENLLKYCNKKDLKFIINTSSLASIVGDISQIDYCAANSYLDYLIHDKTRLANIKILSINWPGWSDIGLVKKLNKDIFSVNTVTSEEGGKIFYQWINQSQHNQIIVSKLTINALRKQFLQLPAISSTESSAIEIIEKDYSELEYKIACVIANALGIKKISIDIDFYQLGGNSLLATHIVHAISKQLGFYIDIATVLRLRSAKKLAEHLNMSSRLPHLIEIKNGLTRFPLSFSQERLCFMEKYEQGTNLYHIPMVMKLDANSSVKKLVKALQTIVERHEILRSIFAEDEWGVMYQEVKSEAIGVHIIHSETFNNFQSLLHKHINTPFNLEKEYPIKIYLYEIKTESLERFLLINIHHIAADGWSMDILQKELLNLLVDNPTHSNLSIQYKDFAVWQREYFSQDKYNEQLAYWRTCLSDYQVLNMPTDKQRPSQQKHEGSHYIFSLDEVLSTKLRNFCREKGYTLYTVMLAGLYVLLNKYSQQKDIVIGTPLANRHHEQTQHLIGCFINLIPLREVLDLNQSMLFLIEQIQQHFIEAQAHQEIPFEKIVQHLIKERDMSRHPIFQVLFSIQNFGGQFFENNSLFQAVDISPLYSVARFDLEFLVDDASELIKSTISYATSLYWAKTIEQLAHHYIEILKQFSEDSTILLHAYEPLLVPHKKIYGKELREPVTQFFHEVPCTSLEKAICEVYAEVFNLPVKDISVHDNFFRLGGDSIIAIRLVSRLNRRLEYKLTVRDVFVYPTPAGLGCLCENIKHLIRPVQKISSIVENRYPASQLQIGMLFESMRSDVGTYHDVFFYEIMLPFNESDFIRVWKILIQRHELLRARFEISEEGYDCVIEQVVDFIWQHYKETSTESLIESERKNVLDISHAGIFRVLVNQYNDRFDLIFSFHHAIADGWSVISLIHEFICLYRGEKIGEAQTLSYYAFVECEREAINNAQTSVFWSNYLSGIEIPKLSWIKSESRSLNGLYEIKQPLSSSMVREIHQLSRQLSVSVESIFLYAYVEMLGQFLNQRDIVVGLTLNNRLEEEGGDELLGLFLNMVPLRWNTAKGEKIGEKITGLFHEKINLYPYRYYPYSKMKALLGEEGVQTAFNFIHFHIIEESRSFIERVGGYERTNIPLVFYVAQEGGEHFTLQLIAHDTVTSESYLSYLMSYIVHHLKRALDQEREPLLLQDKHQFSVWNETGVSYLYNLNETIMDVFERQVRQTPKQVALIYEDNVFTYQDLNARANQLSHYLQKSYQIKGDDRIGLCFSRSEKWIIGMLGILKSGGAYVPIDSSFPSQRIEHILNDAQVNVLLVEEDNRLLSKLNSFPVTIDIWNEKKYDKYPSDNPVSLTNGQHLAYVIYTSGTTGQPKGVMIEHSSVVNLIAEKGEKILKNVHQHGLLYANYIFDAHVWESFPLICNGHTLHIVSTALVQDTWVLNQYITQHNITIATIPPALLTHECHLPLKTLIVAGQSTSKNIMDFYTQNNTEVINAYGPTEATVCSTFHRYYLSDSSSNIGQAIRNVKLYILNQDMEPLPIGVIGELYIGGIGLARGYLNQPALTEQYFISNPFQTTSEKQEGRNKRLYKTGDLVRRLFDGDIEYIGRQDSQVKIHGYRIELSEVEQQVLTHPLIEQATVQIIESSNHKKPYLAVYYKSILEIDKNALRKFLKQKLPAYMIPSFFIPMDILPLTIQGKIDKNALHKPDRMRQPSYTPPKNNFEKLFVNAMTEVLDLPEGKIGRSDDFFDMGGSSILTIKLVSKLKTVLNREIGVSDVLKLKTSEKMASYFNPSQSQVIQPYNAISKSSLQMMLFIHPANAGAEVYKELAEKLSTRYYCVGINNYNLLHENPIENFSKLAEFYLEQLLLKYSLEEPINIFAWSLGGQIALEMARILEEKGYRHIILYLLDTIIPDVMITTLRKQVNFDGKFISEGERKLAESAFTLNKLYHTKIFLFKATKADSLGKKELSEYFLSLPFNNIEKHIDLKSLVKYDINVSHDKIIKQHDLIVSYLVEGD
jgi:amino acid adenylation domain-containing protein